MEMADLMVVNKADEGNEKKALQLERLLLQLMPAMSSPRPCWEVPVLSVSSRNGAGLDDVSASIEAFQHTLIASGYLEQNRRNQALDWMRHAIDAALQDRFERHRGVQQARPALEAAVQTGKLSAVAATETLLRIFESEPENSPNTG
jgi:LAO/AO transport system kinase